MQFDQVQALVSNLAKARSWPSKDQGGQLYLMLNEQDGVRLPENVLDRIGVPGIVIKGKVLDPIGMRALAVEGLASSPLFTIDLRHYESATGVFDEYRLPIAPTTPELEARKGQGPSASVGNPFCTGSRLSRLLDSLDRRYFTSRQRDVTDEARRTACRNADNCPESESSAGHSAW